MATPKRLALAIGIAITIAFHPWANHSDAQNITKDAEVKASESLIKAFVTICLQAVPDLDRMEDSAKEFGWKEVSGLVGEMAPTRPQVTVFKTWMVEKYADVPFYLGVFRETSDGAITSSCKISNPEAPASSIRSALISSLSLGEGIRIENKNWGTSMWSTHYASNDFLISFSDGLASNESGVTLSAATVQAAK